ncbi:MAG TPA: radical SAM protein [Lentisphaeria bacterium]|nr:MAG: hypothetical protein A2X48_15885 [Lentisphaerae bacterium GWF2_49_21]HBC85914.1 radical SAM protein [Lentisphaeria bacterium]
MKRFKKIYVEITNVCNLSCSICPGTKRSPSHMEPAKFESVLEKISPFSDYLYLHVMGEPLLHPEFPDILGLCELRKFKVNIATNGVLIGKHKDAILASKSVRQVNFSIHCLDIQKNSKLPRSYLSDILEFIDEGRRKTKIYFALRLWNMKPGADANPEILRQIEKFFLRSGQNEDPDNFAIKRYFNTKEGGHSCPPWRSFPAKPGPPKRGLENPRSLEEREVQCDYKTTNRNLKEKKGVELAPNVFLNFAQEFKWPDLHSKTFPEGKVFCRGMRDHCAILVDGTVVPCCLDKDGVIPLGNIFADDFSKLISGVRAEKIVKGFSEGRAVEELCKSCEFRNRFSKANIAGTPRHHDGVLAVLRMH